MPAIDELLRAAAPQPARPFDADDVRGRARRLRRTRTVGRLGLGAVALAGLGLLVSSLLQPQIAFAPAGPGAEPAWTPPADTMLVIAELDAAVDEQRREAFRAEVTQGSGVTYAHLDIHERAVVPVDPSDGTPLGDVANVEVFEGDPVPLEADADHEDAPGEVVVLRVGTADLASLRAVHRWLREQPEVVTVHVPECSSLTASRHDDLGTVRARLEAFGCTEDDVVPLAAGEWEGVAWVFAAVRDHAGPGPLDPERGGWWCYGLSRATGLSARSCVGDDDGGLAAVGMQLMAGPGSPLVVHARVPSATAAVELVDGAAVVATLEPVEAGPAGRVAFGVVPEKGFDLLRARDAEGNLLDEAQSPPGPAHP